MDKSGLKKTLKPQPLGVLFSGGLDSAALIGHALRMGYDIWPVYVASGLRWEAQELYWARRFLQSYRHPRLRPLAVAHCSIEGAYRNNWSAKGETPGASSPDTDVYLPARNLLLTTNALLHLSSYNIYAVAMATLALNPFRDGRRSYFDRLEKVLADSFDGPVKIHTPFRKWTKAQVIKSGMNAPLHLTLSCINPGRTTHCGLCNKCAERRKAFEEAEVRDETVYENAVSV